MLVIACVAAVMLRDARWWARCWAWLVVVVLLGRDRDTDVLHAMSYGLRQRPTEGVVAAAPVVAVLLAFSLFLTMLRQSRPQAPEAAGPGAARRPARSPPRCVPIALPAAAVTASPSARAARTAALPVSAEDALPRRRAADARAGRASLVRPGRALIAWERRPAERRPGRGRRPPRRPADAAAAAPMKARRMSETRRAGDEHGATDGAGTGAVTGAAAGGAAPTRVRKASGTRVTAFPEWRGKRRPTSATRRRTISTGAAQRRSSSRDWLREAEVDPALAAARRFR